jgi:hypothetical protein
MDMRGIEKTPGTVAGAGLDAPSPVAEGLVAGLPSQEPSWASADYASLSASTVIAGHDHLPIPREPALAETLAGSLERLAKTPAHDRSIIFQAMAIANVVSRLGEMHPEVANGLLWRLGGSSDLAATGLGIQGKLLAMAIVNIANRQNVA